MPEYKVDQMDGEIVLSSVMTIAATPIKAAEKASGREVTFSPDKRGRWVRVQEGARPPFENALLGSAAPKLSSR